MNTSWAARTITNAVALVCLALVACDQPEPPSTPRPVDMRRLSNDQYRNIVADVFGPHITVPGQADALLRTEGLTAVGARLARITPSGFEKYYGMARAVAQQVVAEENRDSTFSCQPASSSAPDDACAQAFFSTVGRLLYRRPLTEQELATPVMAAHQGALEFGDFYKGVALGLTGMMTTPQFLFIVDTTEPDPDHPGAQRLTGHSKAARLSFLLWNTTANDDLLQAAERGELHTKAGLTKQVDKLMASRRFETGVRAFFEDFLRLDQFETLEKDTVIYPAFTLKVAEDAKEQLLRTVVDHLIQRENDYRDLYTTRQTFMSGALARVYRVSIDRPAGGAWVPFTFPENDPRAGIISQIGFAALASHPGRSSATLRGRAIREAVLCQKVPDPPGDVDFSLFEAEDNQKKTARERLTVHRTAAACAGCHQITDPLGLGLENLDGLGQFRTVENGTKIDASGDLDGVAFADAAGVGRAVSVNPATPACVVERLTAYGFGRTPGQGEKDFEKFLNQSFADDGYKFTSLIRRLALSDAFFAIATPEAKNAPQPPTTKASLTPLTEGKS